MKFGLFYEHKIPRPWLELSEYDQNQQALQQIELAEQLGHDYAWQVERHFLERRPTGKPDVISGVIELEDLSTREHMLPGVAVANPDMVKSRKAAPVDGTGHTHIEMPGSENDAGDFALSTTATAEKAAG